MEHLVIPILLGVLNVLAGILLLAAKLLYSAVKTLEKAIDELKNSLVWVTNCEKTHKQIDKINEDHEARIRVVELDIAMIKAQE
jgi:Sec-independent protein translocase protein TatA